MVDIPPRARPILLILGVAAIVLGLAVLFLALLDTPPPEPPTASPSAGDAAAGHVTNGGAGVVPGLALHPGPAAATLAAGLLPAAGPTTIRAIGIATPTPTPRAGPVRAADVPDGDPGPS